MPGQTTVINVGLHVWESGYLARILCSDSAWVHRAIDTVHLSSPLTWLALCLDGADRRRLAGHDRAITDAAENTFLSVVEKHIQLRIPPKARLIPPFRDGVIVAYQYDSTARLLCCDIARELQEINRGITNWQFEHHLRGSVGDTLDRMISGLAHVPGDHLRFTFNCNSCEGDNIRLV